MKNAIIKIFVIALSSLIGGLAGAYFVFSVVIGEQAPLIMPPNIEVEHPNSSSLSFAVGEQLPSAFVYREHYSATDMPISLDSIIWGSPCVLVFSSMVCDGCSAFIRQWNEQIDSHINDDVSVILLIPTSDGILIESELDELKSFEVFRYDEVTMRELNVNMVPALVCVDKYGMVDDIQYGFSRWYHRKFIELYTDYDLD